MPLSMGIGGCAYSCFCSRPSSWLVFPRGELESAGCTHIKPLVCFSPQWRPPPSAPLKPWTTLRTQTSVPIAYPTVLAVAAHATMTFGCVIRVGLSSPLRVPTPRTLRPRNIVAVSTETSYVAPSVRSASSVETGRTTCAERHTRNRPLGGASRPKFSPRYPRPWPASSDVRRATFSFTATTGQTINNAWSISKRRNLDSG